MSLGERGNVLHREVSRVKKQVIWFVTQMGLGGVGRGGELRGEGKKLKRRERASEEEKKPIAGISPQISKKKKTVASTKGPKGRKPKRFKKATGGGKAELRAKTQKTKRTSSRKTVDGGGEGI